MLLDAYMSILALVPSGISWEWFWAGWESTFLVGLGVIVTFGFLTWLFKNMRGSISGS